MGSARTGNLKTTMEPEHAPHPLEQPLSQR